MSPKFEVGERVILSADNDKYKVLSVTKGPHTFFYKIQGINNAALILEDIKEHELEPD